MGTVTETDFDERADGHSTWRIVDPNELPAALRRPSLTGTEETMTQASTPTINVRITAVLQKLTNGQKQVQASGGTVGDVLADVDTRFPGFKEQVYGEDGKLHRFVNIYLNDEDIRYMGGVEAAVKPGDTLDVLPALAGGA